MPYPSSGNTENGFTIVEVLVAFSAMAIGFVILWGMHFASLKMETSDKLRAEGLRLAQAVIERQRPDNCTVYPGSNNTISRGCDSANTCNNVNLFTTSEQARFQNCTIQENWPSSWERQVRVTVTWNERISLTGGGGPANKRPQSVQLNTIYIIH